MANNSYEEILKQTSSSKSLLFDFKKTYPAYIVLIILLVFSFFVKNFFENRVKEDNNNEFNKAITSILSRIDKVNSTNSQVLNSMNSIYQSLNYVSRDYFYLYGSVPVKTYPSILSISFAPKVESSKLSEFEFYTKQMGYQEYSVYPKRASEYYFPIQYIVLDSINVNKRGMDFGAFDETLKAIELARDNNMMVSTNVFEIRKPDTIGVYMIAPVFNKGKEINTLNERKQNFQGIVALELDIKKFFEQAIGKEITTDKTVVFQVFDDKFSDKAIFESKNVELLKTNYTPIEQTEEKINILNKELLIKFQTTPDFVNSFQTFLPTLAFIISVSTSFLFFGFILSVTTSRARALDLAEKMTRSQRRIVESSKDLIGVMSLDFEFKSINPAVNDIMNYDVNELIGKKINSILADIKDFDNFLNLLGKSKEDYNERIDTKILTKNNDYKWISWNFTISQLDNLVYFIGRDVTLEKLAEEQAKLKSKQVQLAEQFTREASEFKSFFIRKLSHYLRNSLTGVTGYLQLLNAKVYDSEEEQDMYVEMAMDSAEEVFSFVADMDEIAQYSDHQLTNDLSSIKVYKFIEESKEKYNNLKLSNKIEIDLPEECRNAIVIADRKFISDIFVELYKALSVGLNINNISINAQENPYEGATEIQILSSPNNLVAEKIEYFKKYKNNLIDALKYDSKDILLNFAIADSNLRMINGVMTLESLGPEDGNLIQIILPSNKKSN